MRIPQGDRRPKKSKETPAPMWRLTPNGNAYVQRKPHFKKTSLPVNRIPANLADTTQCDYVKGAFMWSPYVNRSSDCGDRTTADNAYNFGLEPSRHDFDCQKRLANRPYKLPGSHTITSHAWHVSWRARSFTTVMLSSALQLHLIHDRIFSPNVCVPTCITRFLRFLSANTTPWSACCEGNRQSYALFMILEPTAPSPGTSKTMKIIIILCISSDSGANRPPPARFQNHENVDRSMNF